MEDTQSIMSEAPGGDNHGFAIASYTDGEDTPRRSRRDQAMRLSRLEQTAAPGQRAGFGIVAGKDEGGLVAHRGTLHPDEYVDFFALREAVEADLGFAYADVAFAFAKGRPSTEQRQLREKIDARLLALSRAGGNMEQLALALGLNEKTLDRALTRARLVEVDPVVKDPAVVTTLVCFKTGEPPATTRKRRFSDSPPQWTGTINLSDAEYAKGFDTRPGNPAYWEFRERRR